MVTTITCSSIHTHRAPPPPHMHARQASLPHAPKASAAVTCLTRGKHHASHVEALGVGYFFDLATNQDNLCPPRNPPFDYPHYLLLVDEGLTRLCVVHVSTCPRERERERLSSRRGGRAGVRLGKLNSLHVLSGIGRLSFFESFCCQMDILGHSALPGASLELNPFLATRA